jgi:ankyrin repeat protein
VDNDRSKEVIFSIVEIEMNIIRRLLFCIFGESEPTSKGVIIPLFDWCMVDDDVLFKSITALRPSVMAERNSDGDTLLTLMSQMYRPNLGIVRHILLYPYMDPNNINNDGYNALYYMIVYNNVRGVEMLLRHPSIDVNILIRGKYTPLTIAAIHRYMRIVDMLLYYPRIQVGNTYQNVRSARIRDMIRSRCNSLYSRVDRSPGWMLPVYSDISIHTS